MVDISSQNNKINVTVSSSGNTANTNVTPDYAQYYSEKSKEWAISNKIVDNTDYSSKYYANESKKQADISTAKATEVVESGNTAVSNIESARDNAIINITNQESLSVDNVNTAGATQITNVNSAGATQINLAKEQVTLATNQATIATEQATIATNKASEVVSSGNEALSDIDKAKTGAITDITDLKNTSISNITTAKDNAITSITNQETTSKNNVIATGNEQVERVIATGNNYDNLTHKNITNCLLEVPQRIKYTLENGTLTIKAGSVVIVPYGTEDLTAQYPKGATFINDNFKVYDTQFSDGKFFVWADLVNDIVASTAGSDRVGFIDINLTDVIAFPAVTLTSGTTIPTTGRIYNTDTNLYYEVGEVWVYAFPIMIVNYSTTNGYTMINQVFNGMGYIGSTVWVDKGVKGLIPDGRNADGTLKNIEHTIDNILVYTNQQFSTYNGDFSVKEDGGIVYIYTEEVFDVVNMPDNNASQGYYYVSANNKMYWHPTGQDYQEMNSFKVGTLYSNGSIWEDADIKLPFRAVDYNDFKETTQRYVVEKSNKSLLPSWYTVYSDGWCEQAGLTSSGTGTKTINLLKQYCSTTYSILMQPYYNTASHGDVPLIETSSKTVSSFKIQDQYAYGSNWETKGYIS